MSFDGKSGVVSQWNLSSIWGESCCCFSKACAQFIQERSGWYQEQLIAYEQKSTQQCKDVLVLELLPDFQSGLRSFCSALSWYQWATKETCAYSLRFSLYRKLSFAYCGFVYHVNALSSHETYPSSDKICMGHEIHARLEHRKSHSGEWKAASGAGGHHSYLKRPEK